MFPSRTETFGNVLLEAMASGLPVASVPAPGPVDIIQEGVNGAIDDDLMAACMRAVRCGGAKARASIAPRTLAAGHEVFRNHLVPLQPQIPVLQPAPEMPMLLPQPQLLETFNASEAAALPSG